MSWKWVSGPRSSVGAAHGQAVVLGHSSSLPDAGGAVCAQRLTAVTFDKDKQVEFDRNVLREMAKEKKAARANLVRRGRGSATRKLRRSRFPGRAGWR